MRNKINKKLSLWQKDLLGFILINIAGFLFLFFKSCRKQYTKDLINFYFFYFLFFIFYLESCLLSSEYPSGPMQTLII